MNSLLRFAERLPRPVIVVIAIAAIGIGIALAIRPTTALGVLALLIGAGLVLAGVLEAVSPAVAGERIRMLLAGALIAGGIFVLVAPGLTVRALAIVVGVTLIVRGMIGVSAIIGGRNLSLDRRVAEVLLGVAGITFGVLAMIWPDITLLVVAVVFGASLALFGAGVLIRMMLARRQRKQTSDHKPESLSRRWFRTIGAVCAIALAAGAVVVSVTLREGSPVVDDFYAAPRTVPERPGQLIRAEEFTRDIPENATAWRILYTTTHADGSSAVASGIVVVPDVGEQHPVIAWHHGTTGYSPACAPSLASAPFESGALFVTDAIIDRGWALVATDYVGLGTEGPHPYLIGDDSARAELDAVRAARQLSDAEIGDQTVAWGHSQGGAASLWSAAIAEDYAPDVPLEGAVALAPASDLPALVANLGDVAGGSVFASFLITAYSKIYPDVRFADYVRPGAEVTVRQMATRCLAEPAMLVSVLTMLALKDDPDIISRDPASGPLGERLEQNVPPASSAVPVLLGQGEVDDLVLFDMQSAFAQRMCAEGAPIDFRSYPGRDHLSLVQVGSDAIDDAFAWTDDRFAGVAVADACGV
ncbi:lipase family protein [Microbacterium sp. H1-D42]|uniref:lipase family protein n=1 Tax=Microbacterium sp. H1-D42 TaxID=2925844 RepID=UPI001F533B43|nr:lipase family protein [Microbacterium sp. H1-D42]UNK71157.1 DUF308 domain-containing protein [Microbacterium sp. H1-D42]